MPKLLPLTTLCALFAAPALVAAAPQAAVSLRARATVSHAELADNTARGLATPVGIATAGGEACELRCVLADSDEGADDTDVLLCAFGEVRSIRDGFELTATWSEAGVTFEAKEELNFETCS